MDEALEELYAEFDRTYGIPSSAYPISSTSVNNKRSSAQIDNPTSRFKKINAIQLGHESRTSGEVHSITLNH